MGLSLAQIRAHVYTFFELDTDDVSHALIDSWAGEGYRRIAFFRKNWPFYEGRAQLTTVSGTYSYTDTELGGFRSIESVIGPDGPMTFLHRHDGDSQWLKSDGTYPSGRPRALAEWGDTWFVYPTPDDAYTITVLGYREPASFGLVAGDEPDLPEQLHDSLLMWVKYRAYLHQDDTELAEIEKFNFDEGLDKFVRDITSTEGTMPVILGGGTGPGRALPGRIRYPWE